MSDFTGKILSFLSELNYKRHEIPPASYSNKWSILTNINHWVTIIGLLYWMIVRFIGVLVSLVAGASLVETSPILTSYWSLSPLTLWLLIVIFWYSDEVRGINSLSSALTFPNFYIQIICSFFSDESFEGNVEFVRRRRKGNNVKIYCVFTSLNCSILKSDQRVGETPRRRLATRVILSEYFGLLQI